MAATSLPKAEAIAPAAAMRPSSISWYGSHDTNVAAARSSGKADNCCLQTLPPHYSTLPSRLTARQRGTRLSQDGSPAPLTRYGHRSGRVPRPASCVNDVCAKLRKVNATE